MFAEFKEFISRGNVMELAVGVILAGAFGAIVNSLVADVLMPLVGYFSAGIDFSNAALTLGTPEIDPETGLAVPGSGGVVLAYGRFIQAIISFLIVAFVIFLVVKAYNQMLRKQAAEPEAPPAPSKEETLLTEIRDLLARNPR